MLPLLASRGNAGDESFFGEMEPTPELLGCPYLMEVLSSFGAILGRTRLMRLAGQAEVSSHVDRSYYWTERVRVHVPIRTQPSVRFMCGGETIHMAEGECWIFDTWREHKVLNDASEQRVHLVADTVGGGDFWSLVDQGRPHDARPEGWQVRNVISTQTRNAPTLICERYNLPRVMSPWEMDHHLQGFNGQLIDQDSTDATQMRMACVRLTRAWRGLWAHFGDSAEGAVAYRALLQAFLDELPETVGNHGLRNGITWFQAVAAAVLQPAVRD
jgi:hypothetical protein